MVTFMRKRIFIAFLLTFLLFNSDIAQADKIFLKSGEVIDGEIIHESSVFVRIKISDMSTREYLQPLIDHLEFGEIEETTAEEVAIVPEGADELEPVESLENLPATITLKSGRTIKGIIIRQNDIFVRVKTDDMLGVEDFMMDHVENITLHSTDSIENSLQISSPKAKDAPVLTEVEPKVTTVQEVAKIAPYQKVISKDTPTPLKSSYGYGGSSFSSSGYGGGGGGAMYDTDIQTKRRQAALEMQRRQMARIEERPEVAAAQQQAMMDELTEMPSIFNPSSFNRFLDQVISGDAEVAPEEKSILKKVMSARPGENQESKVQMDKVKTVVGKIIAGIVFGIIAPIVAAIVLLLINIFRAPTDKRLNQEVYEEIATLEKMKEENKVSDEEHALLVKDAKSRIKQTPMKMFWTAFPRVFIYPFRPQVLLAAVGASVVFYIVRIAMMAPFYGFFATIFAYVYLVACFIKIIETAVQQEKEGAFDWPSFTEMVDWFGKGFLFIIGWLMCHGTAFFLFFNLVRFEPIRFFVVALSVALLLIGMFVYPMVILSMSLVGGAASLNIINVFKAIGETYVAYVFLLFLLFMTQIFSGLTQMIPLTGVPLFGSIFKWFLFVYFMLVDMRLIGIFYKTHRTVLQWYGEDE